MEIDYNQDGISHINVYSKGKTKLGRFLSNFSYSPFHLDNHGRFDSIEGYWYWLRNEDDKLRYLCGFSAKKYGRKIKKEIFYTEEEFRNLIKKAIFKKLISYPLFFSELINSKHPLVHYYVFGNKCINAGFEWIIEFIDKIRKQNIISYNITIKNKTFNVRSGHKIILNGIEYIFFGNEFDNIDKSSLNHISIEKETCNLIIKKGKFQ